MWTREAIVKDLEQLKAAGKKPVPLELKEKYGYLNLSEFFPLLDSIGRESRGLGSFVDNIFKRVDDRRDLHFRYGRLCTDACSNP